MNKNLAVNAGYCHHRGYIPRLLELVRTGQVNPSAVLTEEVPIGNVIEAYKHFDKREPGWVKVALKPVAVAARRVA